MKLSFLVGATVGLAMGIKASEKHGEKIRYALHKVRNLPVVASSLDTAGEKVGQVVRNVGYNLTERAVNRVQQSVFGMNSPLIVKADQVPVLDANYIHPAAERDYSGSDTTITDATGDTTASNSDTIAGGANVILDSRQTSAKIQSVISVALGRNDSAKE